MTAADRNKLLADVEAFCQEIRPHEELCYVEHRFNDQVVPLAKKHNLLGMLTPTEYGGRGADAVTYFRALARIGREGTGVRTFFSGHISIGAYPILTWGTDEQKQRYLPAACRGEKILAFGLTEPDAGSNPLEMTTTYETTRRPLRPQRRQVPDLQRRHRRRGDLLRLPGQAAGGRPAARLGVHRGHASSRASWPRT